MQKKSNISTVPWSMLLKILHFSFAKIHFNFSKMKINMNCTWVPWNPGQPAAPITVCSAQLSLLHKQGVSKWLELFQSAITTFKTHTEVSFPYGMKQQVFKFCAHAQSHSPLLSRSVTEQNDNGDSGAKRVLCVLCGIGLSPRCVLCDEGCVHRAFVGMCHKLVELLFHFYYYL